MDGAWAIMAAVSMNVLPTTTRAMKTMLVSNHGSSVYECTSDDSMSDEECIEQNNKSTHKVLKTTATTKMNKRRVAQQHRLL